MIYDRIPREELLHKIKHARVLLAPSLSDGIPNSLYEAMAAGVAPIVSPLKSFSRIFTNNNNVLYARNLYPKEIAKALITLMNDDDLVNRIAENNYTLVKKIADRNIIRQRAIEYYNYILN